MNEPYGLSEVDETFDLVIVGSGGGSMCAALVAARAGLNPLILEKTELFGGTTAKSGGVMWIPDNQLMAAAGIADSSQQALRYLDELSGDAADAPGASPARRQAYVEQAPRMVDFLIGEGIRLRSHPYWPDYSSELPGAIESGRAVFADLFDVRQLGAVAAKLRPNFVLMPIKTEEMWDIALFRTTWKGKWAMAKVALRMAAAKLTGAQWVGSGAALQGRMLQRAAELGVEMRTNARVESLLTDAAGAVTGVQATIDGQPRTIAARRGVLINAGGFSRNQAMRDEWQPGTSSEWTATCPGDTGEMILEMMRIGAAVAQMDEMVGNQVALAPGAPDGMALVVSELAKPHSLVVDQSGRRYLNEAQSYMSFCQAMLARNRSTPAIPSWLVCDSQYLRKYMMAGTMPGSAKPQEWYDKGWLKRADTLAGLAAQCGIDETVLAGTIERFNDHVSSGKDPDFGRGDSAYSRFLGDSAQRPSPALGTVEKGPFYAYQFYPGDVGTFGGVVTDVNARVLREDGTAIAGLYATGISTASVMGRNYPGAGSSVGPSFVWGYVAALHATQVCRNSRHSASADGCGIPRRLMAPEARKQSARLHL